MKKFSKYFSGMTLLEVCTILFICGVIATVFISNVNPGKSKFRILYNAAFMHLSNINKELYLQYQTTITDFTSYTDYYTEGFRTFPSDPSFCVQMASTANTIGAVRCGVPPFNDEAANFSDRRYTMTFTNGQRIYYNPSESGWVRFSSAPNFGYRAVRMDIDGAEGPNSQAVKSRNRDVFWFEIDDHGEVYPVENRSKPSDADLLGATMTFDFDEYLLARVVGYDPKDNTRHQPIYVPIPLAKVPLWYKNRVKPAESDTPHGKGTLAPVPYYIAHCASAPRRSPHYFGTPGKPESTWNTICVDTAGKPNNLYRHKPCEINYGTPENDPDLAAGPKLAACKVEVALPFAGVFYDYKTQGNNQFE